MEFHRNSSNRIEFVGDPRHRLRVRGQLIGDGRRSTRGLLRWDRGKSPRSTIASRGGTNFLHPAHRDGTTESVKGWCGCSSTTSRGSYICWITMDWSTEARREPGRLFVHSKSWNAATYAIVRHCPESAYSGLMLAIFNSA